MYGPRIQMVLLCCLALGTALTPGALADPSRYPQFAQQEIDNAVPVAFIGVEQVKQRLDGGTPQVIIDVRSDSYYDRAHLPGAMSIPLDQVPRRVEEIPRDIPVVLY